MSIITKTNINEIAKELNQAALTFDYLCLKKTEKWLNELLYCLDNCYLADDTCTVNYSKVFGKDYKVYQLAKSYFNVKEYSRAIFYLSKVESPICFFLSVYSKYMLILKKFADNKSDLFTNPDASCMESLQSLRNELKSKYNVSQLDGYTLYIYGSVLSKLKLNEEAIAVLVEAVTKQPMLWCAWLELGNLIRTLDMLNTLNHTALPHHWMKDLFLAYCYMELSLSEEALTIYQDYVTRGFSKSIYINSQIAKCYDSLREGQECKQIFEEIRKLDPFNLDYMDIYSNILFVLEDNAQLAVLAQEASEIDKYRPESCCIIGNYYSLQNDHHKAVTYFQRALKLNPSYLQAWTLMGHEYMELKNSSAAIQSYTHAIELNPKDYRAWYGIGQTYEILKLYSYSLYYYKQVYIMRPNDSRFIVALADVYVKLDKLDDARRCYIKAYSVGDCEGNALFKLAKIYEKQNDPVNAAIAYEKYTQDQKLLNNMNGSSIDLGQAYRYLANHFFKKGKLDNAHESATKCLDFPETRLEAQTLLNQIAQSRNLKETTAECLRTPSMDMDTNGSGKGENLKNPKESQNNGASDSFTMLTSNKASSLQQNKTNDSDSETDGIFNEFQIKRFTHRKDV